MLNLIRRFRRDEQGATAVEYALLIVFVAVIVASGAQVLGSNISSFFSSLGSSLAGAVIPSP